MRPHFLNWTAAGNRHVAAISVVQMIRILGRSQSWIFIPVYLFTIRHVPYFYIGILFFGTAMISLPFSIYGGNLIDRLGRRIAAIWLSPIVFSLLMVLALSVLYDYPLPIIYIAFLLVEPFTSVQGILDNVVVTDTTLDTDRTNAFSMVRIAGNVGFSIGPAVGGFLSAASYFYVFLFPAVLTILEWVVYIRYVTETRRSSGTGSGKLEFPFNDARFIVLCLLIASIWFVAGQWGTTLTLFWTTVDRVPNAMVGVLYSVNGIVVVFLQMPINSLLAKMRDFNRIALGGIIYAVSFFALVFSSNFIFLIADVVCLTIGENVVSPVTYSLIGKVAPREKRGQYFGAFQLILGFVTPLAPVLGTGLLSVFAGDPVMMWGPLLIMGLVVSYLVTRVGRRLMRIEPIPSA